GAKYASSERQVVAVCGDGSFQMSMMELATMKQYDIKVKIVVMRNNYLGMVRQYQHFSLKDRYAMVELNKAPNLDHIAKAYDMKYMMIADMSDLEKQIAGFLSDEDSCLCECLIDPMDLV
nr:acetolactate synthase, large subunit, biosynthetic type [Lachnospiraceae bacterium]